MIVLFLLDLSKYLPFTSKNILVYKIVNIVSSGITLLAAILLT